MKKILLQAFLLAIYLCLCFMGETHAQVPSSLPETPIFPLPNAQTKWHRVIINCDMLETDIQVSDDQPYGSVLKAIVWDNGERPQWTFGTAESWLYVEDPLGNNLTISLGEDIQQPDVVIANNVSSGDNGTPDYIIGIVYVLDATVMGGPLPKGERGYVRMRTYDVFNVGSPSLSVVQREDVLVTNNISNIKYSPGDGNPHIDLWSDVNTPILGYPSLKDFAICWSDSYTYTPIVSQGIVVGANCTSQQLNYAMGDINSVSSTLSIPIPQSVVEYNSDIACYTDVTNLERHFVMVYNRIWSVTCFPYLSFVHLRVDDINVTNPSVTSTHLDSNISLINKIEAMSQYYPGQTVPWNVVGILGGAPWQAFTFNEMGGTVNRYHLSSNYSSEDNKTPGVAAGVDPYMNSNIGNMQYTVGYKPMYYALPCTQNFDLYSQDIDAYTGMPLTGVDYQVNSNSTPICYPDDVSQAYAVSNCSNSGLDILSVWYNGSDIVYKLSPNSSPMQYKPTNAEVTKNERHHIKLYPNPSKDRLFIKSAESHSYLIADFTGRILMNGQYNNNGIDISQLSAGVYLLKSANETVRFTKI